MHHLLQIWFDWVLHGGYLGIIVLMALESSIFPVPSEIVIPPAAFLAAQGKLNLWGVIAAGTFGSWLGASVTYWVSLWLGRILIVKWGPFFAISESKLTRAEHWQRRYEAGGIFFARLLPVIRHLISIPAGIIRMGFLKFSLLTLIGAGAWCSVLAWLGGRVGAKLTSAQLQDADAIIKATKSQSFPIVGAVLLVCVLYFVAMKLTAPKSAPVETLR